MKTKRELLKHFAECGNCEDIPCTDCPYYSSKHCPNDVYTFKKIGAMAILRMFRDRENLGGYRRMNEILYCVENERGNVIAKDLNMDNAMIFVRALFDTYF